MSVIITILQRQLPRLRTTPSLHTYAHTSFARHISIEMTPARTRFAPSPTGFLHLGSLRTALFNYMLAKKSGGQFILRIEDTDQKRTIEGSEQDIIDILQWAGLEYDEGPDRDAHSSYGPYRQSERSHIHREHAQTLMDDGHAYRCFCSHSRLARLATHRNNQNLPTDYDRICAKIPKTESAQRAAEGEAYVIRLRAPPIWPAYNDTTYGHLRPIDNTHAQAQGSYEDIILLKSDGSPTYHLANVIDDHSMCITHVVRATEWMPSTPKHVHLYSTFGWTPPAFVHVGLLQDSSKNKLSKRNGDVYVSEFRQKGYLPEAINNFLALLGWSHGSAPTSDTQNGTNIPTHEDMLTLKDMVSRFSISKLTTGNTIVNFHKLDFLQRHHAQAFIDTDPKGPRSKEIFDGVVAEVAKQFPNGTLEDGTTPITPEYIRRILHANIQNYTIPSQFVTSSAFFFRSPELDTKAATKSKRLVTKFVATLVELQKELEELPEEGEQGWTLEALKKLMDKLIHDDHPSWVARMRFSRLAVTGGLPGPGVVQIMWELGRKRTMNRVKTAMQSVKERSKNIDQQLLEGRLKGLNTLIET